MVNIRSKLFEATEVLLSLVIDVLGIHSSADGPPFLSELEVLCGEPLSRCISEQSRFFGPLIGLLRLQLSAFVVCCHWEALKSQRLSGDLRCGYELRHSGCECLLNGGAERPEQLSESVCCLY